ncbi:hypothetical protein NDU88_002211 [Pleurodeles waltl]|uniref:Uncharacterized protein n=1 Tax=Pleurodeles waltl TaxID=8319 RepID=A0AAV7SC16_PLEWA|nr:hypothetical protein NDU88_002211 [Pleurodeles waltl]
MRLLVTCTSAVDPAVCRTVGEDIDGQGLMGCPARRTLTASNTQQGERLTQYSTLVTPIYNDSAVMAPPQRSDSQGQQAHTTPAETALKDANPGVSTSLESKINSVTTEVTLLQTDHRALGARVAKVEDTIAILTTDSVALKTQVKDLQVTTVTLETRLEDFESRSC